MNEKSQAWNVSFETKCQGMNLNVLDSYHAISFPIYQTATFSHTGLGESSGFDYTRSSNPTRSQLESIICSLENGCGALALSSGMSAINVLFEVDSPKTVKTILDKVELFYFAESLGGTETLITYPLTQTHAEVPEELRKKNGITDTLLRLSVGIEGADDLIAELDRLFKLARG